MNANYMEKNAEINFFIGMKIADVEADLTDKRISYRIHTRTYMTTTTPSGRRVEMWNSNKDIYDINRVNLVVEDDIVVKTYYG